MSSYRLSPAAVSDLDAIWEYTAGRWGADQAESYLREIQTVIERCAENPSSALPGDSIRAGYRKIPIGSHLVFFRPLDDSTIDVVRILHQRMDPNRHL